MKGGWERKVKEKEKGKGKGKESKASIKVNDGCTLWEKRACDDFSKIFSLLESQFLFQKLTNYII